MTYLSQPSVLAMVTKPPVPPAEGQLYFSEAQVALRYGLSPRTLQDWRLRGTGPRYTVLNGRTIRYSKRDLEEWEASQPVRQSTSEHEDASPPPKYDPDLLEDARRGAKILKAASEGGKAKADAVQADQEARWQEWRRRAVGIWDRHPDWSASDVARQVAKGSDYEPDTVRRRVSDLNPRKK